MKRSGLGPVQEMAGREPEGGEERNFHLFHKVEKASSNSTKSAQCFTEALLYRTIPLLLKIDHKTIMYTLPFLHAALSQGTLNGSLSPP